MRRASLRLAVITGAAMLALAGGAEVARACNEPYISASPSTAGPGDTIRWTIANVEPRASYTVRVAGRPAADGVAGASAPSGTYVIPDLGSSPRTVFIEFTVVHDESSTTHPEGSYNGSGNPDSVEYRPATAAPQEAPQDTRPATPAPADPGGASGTADPAEKDPAGKPVGPGPRTDPPAVREPARRSPAPVPTVVPVADQPVPERHAVPTQVQPRAEDREPVTAKASRVAAQDPVAIPGPQSARRFPLVAGTGASGVASVEEDEEGAVSAIVVMGLSTLVVIGVGGVALWALWGGGPAPGTRRDVRGPQWVPPGLGLEARRHDLLVEAELQELIAEERARQVAREAAAIRTRPG